MNRLLGLLFVLGLVAIPFSHAIADRPSDAGQRKVLICHITDDVVIHVERRRCRLSDGSIGHLDITTHAGHVISVAEPAVDAHLNHGDCFARSLAKKGDDCRCRRTGECVPNH